MRTSLDSGIDSDIKVIKPGKKPEEKTAKVTCRSCEAILLVKKRAVPRWKERSNDYPIGKIQCPECKENVWISLGAFR